jgi:hypothetical protein
LDFNQLPPEEFGIIGQVVPFLIKAFAGLPAGFKTGPSGAQKTLHFEPGEPLNWSTFIDRAENGGQLRIGGSAHVRCSSRGDVYIDGIAGSAADYYVHDHVFPDFEQGVAETAAHETGHMFGMMHNGSPFSLMFSGEKALVTPLANPRWANQYHRRFEDVDVAWLSGCAP